MKQLQVQFSIRIEKEIKDKINEIASRNRRSMNGQIEFILKNAVDDYEKVNGRVVLEEEE